MTARFSVVQAAPSSDLWSDFHRRAANFQAVVTVATFETTTDQIRAAVQQTITGAKP